MLFGTENVRAMQTAAEVCKALIGTQGRLFDGWPAARLYSMEYDTARVQRVREASHGMLDHITDEIIFDVCSELAARRRGRRYDRYAGQVARAMQG